MTGDRTRRDYDHVILVLQGGGALGAYQAGVYEGMAEAGYLPDWVAGVSIGAVNGALIAGNPSERRIERLRSFWDLVSQGVPVAACEGPLAGSFRYASAAVSATLGVAGFYVPRIPHPLLMPDGTPGALSIYDARQLKSTLDQLADFKLINRRSVRLSVGAVDVRSGNSTYFDNRRTRIGPQHVMASGALPPAFAPVEIDGAHYWDGGIVSNTPLWYVLDDSPRLRALIVQVDLFSASGEVPGNLSQVMERHKDILYSSKTRSNTTRVREMRAQRAALFRLLEKLPPSLKSDPDVKKLETVRDGMHIDIVHLINRRRGYTSHSKDYEFSRATIDELWAAGLDDVRRTLAHPEWLKRTKLHDGIQVYDLARGPARADSRESA